MAGRVALLAWVTLRLPLVVLLLLAEREPLMALLERELGLMWPTQIAILIVSSVRERALLALLGTAVLALAWLPLRLALGPSSASARAIYGATATAALLGFFAWAGGRVGPADAVVAASLAAVLVANLPARAGAAPARAADVFFGLVPGSGLLLPRPGLRWLAARTGAGSRLGGAVRWIPAALPGAAVVSLVAVVFLNASAWRHPRPRPPEGVAHLRSVLHRDPAVLKFADGDFNWIELGRDGHTLYATGHGVGRVLAFDVDALERPPAAARVATPGAEDFAYDRDANELYVYRQQFREVVVLDAGTLDVRRRLRLGDVAPGDATVLWNAAARELLILSEVPSDSAFLVVDGATGEIRARLPVAAGSGGLVDPRRPRLYLTFFRERSEILVYDTERHEIVRTVPTSPRIDGMAFDERSDRLLVGSPLRSSVLRFDAETLDGAPSFDASFGVRSLAIDARRGLLLTASLANNRLDVLDLESGETRARYELGPWLRKIWLDTESGTAYVSSRYGIYRVRYLDRVASPVATG